MDWDAIAGGGMMVGALAVVMLAIRYSNNKDRQRLAKEAFLADVPDEIKSDNGGEIMDNKYDQMDDLDLNLKQLIHHVDVPFTKLVVWQLKVALSFAIAFGIIFVPVVIVLLFVLVTWLEGKGII